MKARCIQESELATFPPHVREIWDWLLMQANHSDVVYRGKTIKRGQTVRSYENIREGLHWMVGWRKMRYSKWDCEKAMKMLKKASMIATLKTTVGMLITICNYDQYQNPKNYESHSLSGSTKATSKPQGTDTINKNEKNEKKEDKYPCANFNLFWQEYPKKKCKTDAYKAWKKLNPDKDLTAQIMDSLAKFKKTADWIKEGGQFVPRPHKWIEGARWEDEEEAPQKPVVQF